MTAMIGFAEAQKRIFTAEYILIIFHVEQIKADSDSAGSSFLKHV